MLDQDLYCPECGTKLKIGEIKRLNSGIDIACSICGTEIIGKEVPKAEREESISSSGPDDLGEKIKKGIKIFVDKVKEFAKEIDGSKQPPPNEYDQE